MNTRTVFLSASVLCRSLLLAGMLACLPPAGSAHAAGRAVWIWEKDSYELLENRSAAKEAAGFFKSKGIDTVYLYADSFKDRSLLLKKPRLYRSLIKRLRREGIKTYALLGSSYLNTETYVLPEKHPEAMAMLKRVLDYNAAAPAPCRFDGVNLDIEPHMLSEWKDSKLQLLKNFLDMGRKLTDLKKAYGQPLPVGPAVPFWLDEIKLEWEGRLKPASEHAADAYDYLALMDYRNRAEGPDGIIAHAEAELEYAALTGRKVVIGLETRKNEVEKVTFNHLREEDLERELSLAEKTFSSEPAFGGFVIHHYRSYRNWLESQRTKN